MDKILYYLCKLMKKARFSAVRNSQIHYSSKVESGSLVVETIMGKHSFCGYDCTLVRCEIGSFCSIANRVSVGGARHPIEYLSTSPVFLSHRDSVKAKFARHDYRHQVKTVIGHDVWIGEGAYIKGGVNVGDGAIIGMGSVVTKNVLPYSIVAGNPAKLIRMRFDEKVIKELTEIKWWNLPENELIELGHYFNDPIAFIEHYRLAR